MAKPLSPSTLESINTARRSIGDLSPAQIFELSTQGLLELDTSGSLILSKKANRGDTRSTRKAEIDAISDTVREAVATTAGGTEKLFRLDDVLKASGLDKSKHRDNILQCLRNLRDEGVLESVKLSDNNFQIFWRLTEEARTPAVVETPVEVEVPVEVSVEAEVPVETPVEVPVEGKKTRRARKNS